MSFSNLFRNLCPREIGQERELTRYVTMTNTFLFNHSGKKILLLRIFSRTCLSFWLVLETCPAKVIYKIRLSTVGQLTLKTEHLVLLLSS